MPVITRDLLNEVRAAADVAIKQLCQQESFIKSLVDSVSDGIEKILTKKFGILEAEMVKLKTDVQVIKDDHKKHVKTLTDKIDTLGKKVTEFPENSQNTIDIMKEINDMRQRENNVLFFGIPEDVSNLENFVRNVVSVIIPDFDVKSSQVARLGRFSTDKSRPVKLTLPNKSSVPVLVMNGKKLQSTEGFSKIYIRPDQTAIQRDHYFNLRRELKQINETGGGEYVIKYKNGFPSIIKKNA
ncbi:hypothetical protein JTB14_036374 [Gonioctena quinquepunctata]|nr:hypothetical protein JTB14_036374 [Gonioctena quinquepunctata]